MDRPNKSNNRKESCQIQDIDVWAVDMDEYHYIAMSLCSLMSRGKKDILNLPLLEIHVCNLYYGCKFIISFIRKQIIC